MEGVRKDPERTEVRILCNRVPIAGARVLEIGCGDGRLTRRIAAAARRLVAIDPNAASVAIARRQLPARLRRTVRFEVGDAETLRFRDGSFDVVVLSWAL
jgi:ubiquinone/menaquinone biosynthesis C-methylase UbiE